MLWLIFSVFCIVTSLIAENAKTNNGKKLLVTILAAVLSLMTGLSGQVATDHANYVNIYEEVADWSYFFNYNVLQLLIGGGFVEPGYALLNILCHKLGLGSVGFFVTIAYITNILMVSTIFKFPRPTLGIMLFIVSTHFFYQTNLVRQMLAVSGFVYSISYLHERRYLAYAISVIILASFHSSALLLMALLAVKVFDNKGDCIVKYGVLFLWVLSLFILLTGKQFGFVSDFLNTIFSGTVYNRYISGDKQLNTGYGIAYIYNVFTALSFYLYSFNKNWNKDKLLYIVMFQIGCTLVNFASTIETMTRFALYFSSFQFLILPFMATNNKLLNGKSMIAIVGKTIYPFLLLYYGVYILGYTFIVRGDTLLGTKMYSLTNFFN